MRIGTVCTLAICLSLAGVGTASAYIIEQNLGGGYANWRGPGWYLYTTSFGGQLTRGIYADGDQCDSDRREFDAEADETDRQLGLTPSGSSNMRCAYFSEQPDFDKLPNRS